MLKTAVILAAGFGARLGEYSLNRPKALLNIGGLSLLERSISLLVRNGIEEIVIGTGFRADCLEAFARGNEGINIRCVRNENYLHTGSLFTLFNLREHISMPFVLLESDLLYENRAIEILQLDERSNAVLASGFTGAGDEVYIEANGDGCLEKLSKNKDELNHVSAEFVGINKLSLEAYQALCRLVENNLSELQSWHYECAFPRLAPEHRFHVLKQDDLVWCEIDDRRHLMRAREMALSEHKSLTAGMGAAAPAAGGFDDLDARIRSRMLDGRMCAMYEILAPSYRGGLPRLERTRKSRGQN